MTSASVASLERGLGLDADGVFAMSQPSPLRSFSEDLDAARGLCRCGCKQRTPLATRDRPERAMRRGEPTNYLRGHFNRPPGGDYSALDYRVTEAGCWEWQRALDGCGYGICTRNGAGIRAHRWYYEQHVGPIPQDKELDHLCSNRRCVNPEHLEPVTHVENVRRGKTPKLTQADVVHIRTSPKSLSVLARELGVGKTTVAAVRKRHTWKDSA